MLVKTFQAVSMSEALRLVKAELGSDAMIISSKKERRKGFFGFLRKPVFEITAALDQPAPQRRPAAVPYAQAKEEPSSTREEFQRSMLEPLVREIRELKDRVEGLTTREPKPAPKGAGRPVKNDQDPAAAVNDDFVPLNNQRPDMDKIRKFLFETVSGNGIAKENKAVAAATGSGSKDVDTGAETAVAKAPERHGELLDELLNMGLDREVCEKLLESASQVAEDDDAGARNAARETLAGMVRCSVQSRSKKKGPRIIALVGPTGVGKTTTIAKLAAMYSLKKKSKVALVTTDTFRAGAVEQIRTYANILRIPMETAVTKSDLEKVLAGHKDKDVILIDTAGKSVVDHGRLDELAVLLSVDAGIEKHLCVSATTRDEDLQGVVGQFKALPVHRVLFTKLDESRKLGCIVNIALHSSLPISYMTNGQRVPEDIEPATGKKVANMLLGA